MELSSHESLTYAHSQPSMLYHGEPQHFLTSTLTKTIVLLMASALWALYCILVSTKRLKMNKFLNTNISLLVQKTLYTSIIMDEQNMAIFITSPWTQSSTISRNSSSRRFCESPARRVCTTQSTHLIQPTRCVHVLIAQYRISYYMTDFQNFDLISNPVSKNYDY